MNILEVLYPLSAVTIIVAACGLGIWLRRRFQLTWRLFWLGGLTFILAQLFHIPFNALLTVWFQQGVLPLPPQALMLFFNVSLAGLTAGLFEETARYLMYRWWAKDARTWRTGLFFGSGHGGSEAMMIGLMALYAYFQITSLRGADLSTLIAPDQLALAQRQISAYWSAQWYEVLLGVLERLFTLPIQLGLSVIVLQVFVRRQIRWLGLAILWHAVVDAVGLYLAAVWGIFPAEGFVFLAALVSLAILWKLYQPEPAVLPEPVQPLQPVTVQPVEQSETAEALDESRYH